MSRDEQLALMRQAFAHIDAGTTDLADAVGFNPVSAYTCPQRLARESALLFRKYPLSMGPSNQIPQPGDHFTDDLSGIPILVVRGRGPASGLDRHGVLPGLGRDGRGRARPARRAGEQRCAVRRHQGRPLRPDRREAAGRGDERQCEGHLADVQGSGARMRKAGGGSIVNISPLAAVHGMAYAVDYGVSKAAVIGITRCRARELGRDWIRVNAVAPSLVLTEGTSSYFGAKHEQATKAIAASQALQRKLEAGDLVGTVAFLLSTDSHFMTGQTSMVDGGTEFL